MVQPELIPYFLFERLGSKLTLLASSEFGWILGVMEKLRKLHDVIRLIEAVLLDAEVRQEQDRVIQIWIRRLKDVLYAADDIVDECTTESLRLKRLDGGKVRSFFSCTNRFLFSFRIAREIRKIQDNIDYTAKFLRQSVVSLDLRQRSESPRGETTSMLQSDVVGREDEKREIIRQLMQPHGNENVSLIGVVGLGGIGKTTVAQMVYNDEKVKGFFEKQIWVYVSVDFDVKSILMKILDLLAGSTTGDSNKLLHMLHENLNDRRYFLVLDGIWSWSHENWGQLKSYLMCGAQGSKILVTTRSAIVTKVMGVNFSFHLESLNEEDSWSLLKKLVFRNDEHLMHHVPELVGRKIVMKLAGVPLAIRTVSVMLRGKYRESEWKNVLETEIWKLDVEDGIMSSLKLSYQHLLPQLKQCFAYCSLYPKDWVIKKNELIQLWMAQDYLGSSNDEREMEDVGNEYVNTLLKMSFFRDQKIDECGDLVSFTMHDLMHDLALLVACNDYSLENNRRVNTPMHMCFSLESNTNDLLGSLNASRLRTFFLQQANEREIALTMGELSVILSFKCLRVLNLSRSSLRKLPDLIGKFKHLRYLDLSSCVKLTRLPKSIGNLVNLQTLKLTGCETLEFSTEVVMKLISLRHLEIHHCKAFEDMMPVGLGKLTSLQSLSSFYVVNDQKKKAGKLNELQNLNNLRGNLEINRLDQVRNVMLDTQDVNLKDKKLLESLDLNWENQDKTGDSLQLLENLCPHQHLKRLHVRRFPGDRFSDWLSSIKNLSHISFLGFDNCKYLPPLEHLPYLKSLEMSSMKALEYICFEAVSQTAATFFRSLESLKFSDCQKLIGWKRMEGDVSPDHLSSLEGMPHLTNLATLEIWDCPLLVERCRRETGVDWPKISHVPNITLKQNERQ